MNTRSWREQKKAHAREHAPPSSPPTTLVVRTAPPSLSPPRDDALYSIIFSSPSLSSSKGALSRRPSSSSFSKSPVSRSSKELDIKKENAALKKKVEQLEGEMVALRHQIVELKAKLGRRSAAVKPSPATAGRQGGNDGGHGFEERRPLSPKHPNVPEEPRKKRSLLRTHKKARRCEEPTGSRSTVPSTLPPPPPPPPMVPSIVVTQEVLCVDCVALGLNALTSLNLNASANYHRGRKEAVEAEGNRA